MALVGTRPVLELTPDQAIDKIRADRRRNSVLAFILGLLALLGFYASIYLAYDGVPEPQGPANANPQVVSPTSDVSTQQATLPAQRRWQRDAIEWYGPWQKGRCET